MIDLKNITAATIAGLLAGVLAGGVGSRIAMRIVALLGGMRPEFTVGGTFAILLMAALIGILFGAVYGLVRRTIPLPGLWKGALYGGFFAILVALPFLLSPEGELALASPAVGVALFAWIPLAYGIGVEWITQRFDSRLQEAPDRQVSTVWFALFAVGVFAALFSMFSLVQEFLYMPLLVVRTARLIGFEDFRDLHALLSLLFALAYVGLCGLILWQGAGKRMASFAVIALLLFAAGFFNDGRVYISVFDFFGVGKMMAGLLRAAGLTALLALLFTWPDGVLRPAWTQRALWSWGVVWLLLWLVVPFLSAETVALLEPAIFSLVMAGLLCGLAAQVVRVRSADPTDKFVLRPIIISFSIALLAFALVWLGQMVYPDIRARSLPLMATPFTFILFLTPWLLLPVGFWLLLRRLGTENREQVAVMPELVSHT